MNYNSDEIFSFILCHFIFLFQVVFVGYIDDEFIKYDKYNRQIIYQNIYLTLNKSIFYIIVFLCFISHIRTAITNPGKIMSKNNMNIIQFYYYVHKTFIEQAIKITEKQTPEVIRNIIFKANNIKFDPNADYSLDNDDDFVNDSDKDTYKFEPKTSIKEELKIIMIRNYRMKLTRCKSCYAVRPHNSHHCNICHKCILEQDHHCPWFANCIGTFNKKFYILYNFYAVLSVIYSLIIFSYFTLYKHFSIFFQNTTYIIFSCIYVIVSIIYGVFTFILIYEQIQNIKHDTNIIDYNNGILLEKSSFKQQITIIFGGKFSIKWFLPFFSGGYLNLFLEMSKVFEKKAKQEKNEMEVKNNDEKEPLLKKDKND